MRALHALALLLLAGCPPAEDGKPAPLDETGPSETDVDGDGFAVGADCDDEDAAVHPEADEICDGVDNDCDGVVDIGDVEDGEAWYVDADGDGFGDDGRVERACDGPPSGAWSLDGGDCDDTDAAVHPDATEVCDGVDNDCDGTEEGAVGAPEWFLDDDGDGHGGAGVFACEAPAGALTEAGDCDDAAASVHPGATEVCDGVDQDCDGVVDEHATDSSPWYVDTDGDGFGDAATEVVGCAAPEGYVADATDCDDADADTSPGAAEVCDGADDDCDGAVDEADAVDARSWYPDADGDRFGAGSALLACAAPAGLVAWGGDCDDADPAVNPAAVEPCDGVDDLNCDGSVPGEDADGDGALACEDCDDADASWQDGTTWYADADSDGFGDAASPTTACHEPVDYTADATDCDDADPATFPGAPEAWYDGVDQGCDGGTDDDADGDGYAAEVVGGDDCDDTDASVNPAGEEVCNDGLDNDCDGEAPGCAPEGVVSLGDADCWFEGETEADYAGFSVGGAGDVLGGGTTAFVVGAPIESSSGYVTGAAYLVTELPSGGTSSDLSAAAAKFVGETMADSFGHSVAAGDLDGDGVPDLVVGAPYEDTAGIDAGATYVFDSRLRGTLSASVSTAKILGQDYIDRSGIRVAVVGDIDQDGYDDLVIGAVLEGAAWFSGSAYLVRGPVSGTMSLDAADAKLDSERDRDEVGSSVGAAGDVDADGFPDFVIAAFGADDGGARDGGAAYLYTHQPSGTSDPRDTADAVFVGETDGAYVGAESRSAGDVNGDGYDDLVVGATGDASYLSYNGRAYLFLGPQSGTVGTSSATATLQGTRYYEQVGWSASGAGDIDLDGYDDVLVGAYDGSSSTGGRTALQYGPFSGTILVDDADLLLEGEAPGDYAGYSVAGIGDMSGDGYPDFLVAASQGTHAYARQGVTYVWLGGGF